MYNKKKHKQLNYSVAPKRTMYYGGVPVAAYPAYFIGGGFAGIGGGSSGEAAHEATETPAQEAAEHAAGGTEVTGGADGNGAISQ